MSDLSKIQIVTLDSPVEIWHDQNVRDLFVDLVQLKLDGYNHGYSGSSLKVLPFDATDFYGIHQAVCIREKGEFVPLLTYKSVPLDYCAQYSHPLSVELLASSTGDARYLSAIRDYLLKAKEDKKRISYDSSLTIDPTIEDVELRYEVFRVFVAAAMYHMCAYGIDNNIISATSKFKTEKTFKKMGCERLAYNGIDLPPAQVSTLSNEEVLFFVGDRDFPAWGRRIMKEYKSLWDQRIIYSPSECNNSHRAA